MLDYELFFKYSMDMLLIAGDDGYFKRVNPALCNMLGRTEAELKSKPFIEWVHPEDIFLVEGALKNLAAGHPAFLVDVRLLAADETYRKLQWSAYPDPKTGFVFAMARDTRRPYLESQRVALLLESSPTAVFLVEQTGIITYCNHLAETIFGYQTSELIGRTIDDLVPLKHRGQHRRHREQYTTTPVLRPMGVLPNLVGCRKNGDEFPIDVGLNPVWLDLGMIIVCSVIDTSAKSSYLNDLMEERRKLSKDNARLGKLANHDALTGLYNRRAFERTLSEELSAARDSESVLSIIMVDIDHFKNFNDKHGHPAGDILLRDLGATMVTKVRKEDTVARIGGEEFVVILPDIHPEQAKRFGERLQTAIKNEAWNTRSITVSLGAATYQFTSKRTSVKRIMKQLIEEADQALYQSKNTGRNRFTHFKELSKE
jgi:diguanylate cyclase (GGDEF)-like protein/PAS domain S-box-containing protein